MRRGVQSHSIKYAGVGLGLDEESTREEDQHDFRDASQLSERSELIGVLLNPVERLCKSILFTICQASHFLGWENSKNRSKVRRACPASMPQSCMKRTKEQRGSAAADVDAADDGIEQPRSDHVLLCWDLRGVGKGE